MSKKRLGEALREKGKISADDLEKVVEEQQGKLVHLGELMLARGIVGKEDLAEALQEVSRVPYLDCATVTPTAQALKLVPRAMAERISAISRE